MKNRDERAQVAYVSINAKDRHGRSSSAWSARRRQIIPSCTRTRGSIESSKPRRQWGGRSVFLHDPERAQIELSEAKR